MRRLDCDEDSVDVFRDCVVENDLGVFECSQDHSDDAGVHCEGNHKLYVLCIQC